MFQLAAWCRSCPNTVQALDTQRHRSRPAVSDPQTERLPARTRSDACTSPTYIAVVRQHFIENSSGFHVFLNYADQCFTAQASVREFTAQNNVYRLNVF